MTQRPRSRIGAGCSITAAGLVGAGAITLSLRYELGFVFLPLSFFVGMIGLAITTIELLAGYRGAPQTISMAYGGASCLLPILYFVVVLGSAN